MKTFLIRLVHYYQDTFNYPLYWKLRLRVQFMGGGVKRKLLIMYLRHIESKKCSTTGLGLMHNCCIIDGPIDLPHGLAGVVIARNDTSVVVLPSFNMLLLLSLIKVR